MGEHAEAGSVVRVRGMRLLTDAIVEVELDAIGDAQLPEWEAGAHIDLVALGSPVRQYSLTGRTGGGAYRIAVLRKRDSRGGSRFVHDSLRVGDVVDVRGPRNHFALEPAAEYLFVAGGIGITPIVPMLHKAESSGTPWTLVYLGTSRAHMPFLEELTAFSASSVHGSVHIVARAEHPRADLAAEVAARPRAVVYACGPERMIDALRDATDDAPERFRAEYFSAPAVEYEPGGAFRIRLQRSGLELDVAPNASIVSVMRDAGVDVLTDCEEGICGSCETHALEGEIEHRDFVLTPQERARNDCLMVCVSRAACPLLVLDA